MTRKQIKEMRKLCYKGKFVTDIDGAITYCDQTSGYMFAHHFNSALEGDAVANVLNNLHDLLDAAEQVMAIEKKLKKTRQRAVARQCSVVVPFGMKAAA